MKKCFKYKKAGHITKDCKEKQLRKKRSIQEESDGEDNKDKWKDFGENPE